MSGTNSLADLTCFSDSYRTRGYVVIPNVGVPAYIWRERVLTSAVGSGGIRLVQIAQTGQHYRVYDRFDADRVVPELGSFYRAFAPELESIVGHQIVLSPFQRSAYYIKVYSPPNGMQGWHYDTNGVTVLIYLTDNSHSGSTVIVGLDGAETRVFPSEGSALVMQGQRCHHRASPVRHGVKVVCPLNYYDGFNVKRPAELDDIIFGPQH